ncbi:SIS domain-containing protein [Oscillochloris sp. ZM17-4]|uniref:D-sedoheptulose-7-phosphate isomerase n=1 Tax=Oscillochloris sp. ZM17-4 TaxID=2866714 RepID=UPI001C73A0C5|nr:SIS domain-containing protein [Oscillochloris sp. ZM17-4]MBX0330721.1 SIS domain-containing protein [Oscillochloris sp. ZM17-4]
MPTLFRDQLDESRAVFHAFAAQADAADAICRLAADALIAGRTLFTCGNGGSATDAIHLAEELVGRYRATRRPFPAVCLNTDVGAITCIANDFGFEQVFARQLEALARPGDLLVLFSTSGGSPNILAALRAARALGVTSIAMLGKGGGAARELADHALVVPSESSARIQEVHTLILHAICEELEGRVVG